MITVVSRRRDFDMICRGSSRWVAGFGAGVGERHWKSVADFGRRSAHVKPTTRTIQSRPRRSQVYGPYMLLSRRRTYRSPNISLAN